MNREQEFFILDYDDERAFRSYDDAYNDDFDRHPEMHPWDDASMERAEQVIFSVSWDELNETQQNYLSICADQEYDSALNFGEL
jgi:hypothetical protein